MRNNNETVATSPFISEVKEALRGQSTMKLRFPVDVFQTDSRTIEVPLVPRDFNMFSTAFAEEVLKAFGTLEGDRFLSEMSELVSRKMFIAEIR